MSRFRFAAGTSSVSSSSLQTAVEWNCIIPVTSVNTQNSPLHIQYRCKIKQLTPIIIINIIILQFIKRLRPWLQRCWRQVSRGCLSKALHKKYILSLDLNTDRVSADHSLRQLVPGCWRSTTKGSSESSRKVCPGERLVQ